MKKGKKSDYDLNMNDYSQMYDYNLITLRLITQLWFDKKMRENKQKQKQETENIRKLRLVKNKMLKGRNVCVEKNK